MGFSNPALLTPPLNLLGQLLPLVTDKLHHGLDLLPVRGDQIFLAVDDGDTLLRSEIGLVDRDHEVHNSGELVGKPLNLRLEVCCFW